MQMLTVLPFWYLKTAYNAIWHTESGSIAALTRGYYMCSDAISHRWIPCSGIQISLTLPWTKLQRHTWARRQIFDQNRKECLHTNIHLIYISNSTYNSYVLVIANSLILSSQAGAPWAQQHRGLWVGVLQHASFSISAVPGSKSTTWSSSDFVARPARTKLPAGLVRLRSRTQRPCPSVTPEGQKR
jgi:hypothetical protein